MGRIEVRASDFLRFQSDIMNAVTVSEILMQYESRLRELQAGMMHGRLHCNSAAVALAIAVALFLTLGLYAVRQQVAFWWPCIAVPFAAVSARRFHCARESRYRTSRLKRFYERAVQRIQGNWVGIGATGEEFRKVDHVYASDLNIFGEGSLFELLCTARTSIGQRGLANYLMESPATGETLLRQEAVRELQGRSDLRERVASLGKFDFLESKWNTFEDWLGSPTLSYPQYLRALAGITSALLAGTVLAGLVGLISWIHVAIWIAPLVVFHSAVGLIFRSRINEMQSWVQPVSVETQVFREGLRLLAETQFQSVKLKHLADEMRNGSESVRTLERLLNAFHERQKEWFYGPSLVLLVGTQLGMAIERWRSAHAKSLRIWMQAWAEFEALNALAAYAYENPDNTFPEFAWDEACFEAQSLGHPLLSRGSCVVNDVTLNRKTRFYMVSGSNMSGKSTLLRAIGLNAVLASAGAPVHATALRVSQLSVFASLSVVDSLSNGTSKFLAEVERLRRTIEAATHGSSVLFLVDEIFGGTNSRDRRIATEAVIRALIERGAIGALSTHDLSLCEIGDSGDLQGVNVHMGSRNGGDPLNFDYRLKPGVTTEANALAIARMAGVPV
jgi:hypothetical protein